MIRSPLFNDFTTLRNRTNVDQVANEIFGGDPWGALWSRSGSGGIVVQAMPLDLYATDDQVVILAAVPGMQPDDLDLTIHQNTLTLSGTIRDMVDADEAKGATWYIHELGSGS